MPAFAAINLEPEENLDEEIDTSRELHIDEALKRFQAALKLHSQGVAHREEAAAEYDQLFQSEIFKFPESVTDFDRAERQAQGRDLPANLSFQHALDLAQTDIDGIAASLPQTLYLAYKNHGQFVLDGIRHKAKAEGVPSDALLDDTHVLKHAQKALEEFGAALDQDPSDAELWRRAARVAAFLRSSRISRYCLEAAIELDDDPAVDEVEPSSLAEGFAGEQLKAQLQVLSDEVALSHPAMGPFVKKSLPQALKKYLDPLPFLPDPTTSLESLKPPTIQDEKAPTAIHVANPTWHDLGLAILAHAKAYGLGADRIIIEMPKINDQTDEIQLLVGRPRPQVEETSPTVEETSMIDSPAVFKEPPFESPTEARAGADGIPESRQAERSSSRKRSQSVAALVDAAEDEVAGRERSKRIRRRETAAEESVDTNTLLTAQLQPFQAADQNLFKMTRNLAENLGMTDRDTLDHLAEVIDACFLETRISKLTRPPMVDLRNSLIKYADDNAKILLTKKAPSPIGLSSFLEHSKPGSQTHTSRPAFNETRGLAYFVKGVNEGWTELREIIYQWTQHMCVSYTESKWSETMKRAVVQVISHLDEDIYCRTQYELSHSTHSQDSENRRNAIEQLIQMLFELHLDIYERITNPNSAVDVTIRIETKTRLARWFSLAAQMSRQRAQFGDNSLSMRFLWSAVFTVTITEGAERDHILQCWKSLRDRLTEDEEPVDIILPNNAVMPEVSTRAAETEISKLTTMDFFLGLFQTDLKDPIAVIDSLEPVLNPASVVTVVEQADEEQISSDGTPDEHPKKVATKKVPISETASPGLRDLWKFLLGTSTELRLFLWTRLGDAYDVISYKTKQFSCWLKSIELVVNDFERDPYLSAPDETRLPLFIKMLKFLDDLLISALTAALNDHSAFDIVDNDHIKSSIAALAKLSCILHVPSMYEDEVRAGILLQASNGATFQSFLHKLREMQVRNWSLLYCLLKAGMAQNKALFSNAESDRVDYLNAVHQVLGLRKFCKSSNKIFIKMMRVELMRVHSVIDNWEDYLGQVLFDLYGLKIGVGLFEVQDHGCPPEKLERKNTISLVPRIAVLANRMPMKDLLKSDLKTTIEHMQQAIGQTKSNQQLIQNLRIFNQTMSKPIHPLRLYEAFKGNIAIDAVGVHTTDSNLAKHRWFFLLGMIAFTKFKGVDLNRRQTPGATDDLRIGATFLRQQLQFTPDQWDAWFRLAECFDYELDEAVLWTADKMNKERAELVKYQRNAIHCYTLALSHSRTAFFDDSEEATDAIHDLYHKFGMRMYASSREPFAMEPFMHTDHKRFVIKDTGADTNDIHSQMQDYKVWKYASGLFKKAMEVKPKEWKNPYMYAKCIWKMYCKPIHELDHKDRQSRPSVETVIKALERSVEVVAALPKPRHGQDPILEPHYKIVSVIHKLVMLTDLQPQEGADILARQPYAIDGNADVPDLEAWDEYVIDTLTQLREKDRSNWQHRIIMRHARILYNEESEVFGYVKAMAAFTVLKESMLTKTMVMNVWKCDAERPGRHHVYTELYVRFVVSLLVELKDRANFELMLRRLRKKGADYYHFSDLWQTSIVAYLGLIRQAFAVRHVEEDEFKSVTQEEFDIVTSKISDWAANPESVSAALNALKELSEVKKLNGGLMKAGPIDDLISDCYTALYLQLGHQLCPNIEEMLAERETQRQQEGEKKGDKDKLLNPFSALLNPQSNDNSGTEGVGGDVTPATNHDGAPRPRKAGIRRADVLRKAEQAVLRAMEGPAKALSRGKSVSSADKTPAADEGGDGDGEHEGDTEMREAGEGEGAESEAESIRGSIHDEADDESDLSDVPPEDLLDDEEVSQFMFPNLMRRPTTKEESSGTEEEDEEEEEEEEDEGDGEEGGQGLGEDDEVMHDEIHAHGDPQDDEDDEDEEEEE
ncbi:hypothetical protein GGR57DRAFT_295811 [Xylariaceae sp. FL1272]|nr:hypothetical protein GGR57DRAFT_295811 [Xylariaceae sp. FL1272]